MGPRALARFCLRTAAVLLLASCSTPGPAPATISDSPDGGQVADSGCDEGCVIGVCVAGQCQVPADAAGLQSSGGPCAGNGDCTSGLCDVTAGVCGPQPTGDAC